MFRLFLTSSNKGQLYLSLIMASAVNVKRLTPYLRQRILQLYQSGVNQV